MDKGREAVVEEGEAEHSKLDEEDAGVWCRQETISRVDYKIIIFMNNHYHSHNLNNFLLLEGISGNLALYDDLTLFFLIKLFYIWYFPPSIFL